MKQNQIICGDALDILKTFPDECINCCVTSPPYFGLRDYGVEGQIGLEETVEDYILRLLEVFREVHRVLKSDGTLWINIGDSYAGSGKGSSNYPDNAHNYLQGTNKGMLAHKLKTYPQSGIKAKDLMGIPWMLALALRNDGWYLRQDIIWQKPNPMPESVRDRCTKSHEYIFLLSKSRKYYFDGEAISEPCADSTIKRINQNINQQSGSFRIPGKTNGPMKACKPRYGGKKYTDTPNEFFRTKSGNMYDFRPRRNKRDVWCVSTQPYKGAHFATFPEKLIEPCILAGCPEGGIVLDPFAGSGTTGIVAIKNNRSYIMIDLNEHYCELQRTRMIGGQNRC